MSLRCWTGIKVISYIQVYNVPRWVDGRKTNNSTTTMRRHRLNVKKHVVCAMTQQSNIWCDVIQLCCVRDEETHGRWIITDLVHSYVNTFYSCMNVTKNDAVFRHMLFCKPTLKDMTANKTWYQQTIIKYRETEKIHHTLCKASKTFSIIITSET